jgi:hypothetical protein
MRCLEPNPICMQFLAKKTGKKSSQGNCYEVFLHNLETVQI